MPAPANPMVAFTADGEPWIRGFRCAECSAVVTVPTMSCRRCFSRSAPEAFCATTSGCLYTWSVVERSFPGVKVPFVSAIVDLDDGLTLKGSLRVADPRSLRQGLPVTLVFDDANGARNETGEGFVGYHFAVFSDGQFVKGESE